MSLFASLDNLEDKPEELIVPKFDTTEYKLEFLMEKIRRIDDFDEERVKEIIRINHKILLNIDQFYTVNRVLAQELFTNVRFLKCLTDIVGTLNIDRDEFICLNRICYDQMKMNNPEVTEKLLSLAYFINDRLIVRLSAYIDMQSARILAIFVNSSQNFDHCVRRVNRYLINYPHEIPPEKIVLVFTTLYDHMRMVIITILLDQQLFQYKEELPKKNINNLLRATLYILLMLTSVDIREVMKDYAYILSKSDNTIRPTMKLKDVKDKRLQDIITEVEVVYGLEIK